MQRLLSKISNTISSRPLLFGCLLFMLLSALLLFSPTAVKLAGGGLCLILFILNLVFLRKKRGFLRTAVTLFIVLLSCLSCLVAYDLFDRRLEKTAALGAEADLTLYFDGVVYESDFSSLYTATVQKVNDSRVFGVRVLVSFEMEQPELYEVYTGTTIPGIPENYSLYYDSVGYYRTQGIFISVNNGDDFSPTGDSIQSPSSWIYRLKTFLSRKIGTFSEGNAEGLLNALMLADRSKLGDEIKRDFKALGISHLLAISGLHLSVLFFMLEKLLSRFLHVRPRTVVQIVFVLFFMALCGFSPSVTRAGIMLILYVGARFFERESDPFTSLFISGALILLFSPFSVFNTAFLLSFFATFGILLTGRILPRNKRKKKWQNALVYLLSAIIVSLSAQIAILPITIFCYGSISVLSPVFTLLFTPLITLILYLAPICLILSFIPFLSPVVSAIITVPCNFTAYLASFAKYFKELRVSVPLVCAVILCVLSVFMIILFFSSVKKKIPSLIGAGCYLLICTLLVFLPQGSDSRMIADQNKKNDILLFYGKGHSVIVDLSDGSKSNLFLALGLLEQETGELYPDTLMLTHYHTRHIKTLESLLGRSYLNFLLLPEAVTDSEKEIAASLESIAEKQGVAVCSYDRNSKIEFSNGIVISNIQKDYLKRSTHPIISFEAAFNNVVLRYYSSSSWEVVPYNGEDLIYFGVHGPVAKKPFSETLKENTRVLSPNEELYLLLFGEEEKQTLALPFVYYFD